MTSKIRPWPFNYFSQNLGVNPRHTCTYTHTFSFVFSCFVAGSYIWFVTCIFCLVRWVSTPCALKHDGKWTLSFEGVQTWICPLGRSLFWDVRGCNGSWVGRTPLLTRVHVYMPGACRWPQKTQKSHRRLCGLIVKCIGRTQAHLVQPLGSGHQWWQCYSVEIAAGNVGTGAFRNGCTKKMPGLHQQSAVVRSASIPEAQWDGDQWFCFTLW